MSLNKYSRKNNPLKPKRDFKSFGKFLAVAIGIMLLFELVLFDQDRPYISKIKKDYWAEMSLAEKALEDSLPPKVVFPNNGAEYFEAPELDLKGEQAILREKKLNIEPLAPKKEPVITKKKTRERPVFTGKVAKIAIVIDDVGVNVKQSRVAITLPKEVTLAFLPYAEKIQEMTKESKGKGHEMLIHIPMEAMSSDVPLGSMALYSNMKKADFQKEFNKIANSFEGYVGVNNHMGSKLTQDKQSMTLLMKELKKRKVFFLDSRTIATSVAADVATDMEVPNVVRDVFLDHEETPEFLQKALEKTESIARRYGSAIAIGHPKEVTMTALKKWIPTLEKKGFELVPLSTLVYASKDKPAGKADTQKEEKKEKEKKKDKEESPANLKNIVGELTAEDWEVVIPSSKTTPQKTGQEALFDEVPDNKTAIKPLSPKKEIIMEKVTRPSVSYPVD